ncbi:MAG: YggS family pyridoxal phosphate-dependent enzyme, partial [Desulfosudaceae bacterium]
MKNKLADVTDRIRRAAKAAGRDPSEITLVAVGKTHSPAAVAEAIAAGARDLGENYIQEAREKIAVLADQPVTWHFIGHLQSNKAKYAVSLFDWIHSLDSLKLARALDREAAKKECRPRVLIQVNLAGEASKSGVAPEETIRSVEAICRDHG